MLKTVIEPISLKEGFSVRPATLNDLEAALELFNACSRDQMGVDEFTLNELKNDWQTPRFNLQTDTRVVFSPQGRLAGYIEVWDISNPPVHPSVWGRVHPDFEGLGIGTFMMAWGGERARRAIDRVPQGARVTMRSGSLSTHEPSKRLLQDHNMQLIRHFWDMKIEMEQAPPPPQWPAGITLRPFNYPQDLETVYHAFDEAFKDHWGHIDRPIEESLERWRHWLANDEDFDPTLWFVAVDGDDIAGLSLCKPKTAEDPDMGWVNILGVRRPWRKLGLGLALLHHSFGEFYHRGKRKVGLGVDAGSLTGATRLYERAGMFAERQFDLFEKELRPGKELGTDTVA